MRMEDIRKLTRAVPFAPFRVFLTSGETYDVRHPDMIVASHGAAFISRPTPAGAESGEVDIVSLVHIMKIEYLPGPTAAQPGSNGPTAAT